MRHASLRTLLASVFVVAIVAWGEGPAPAAGQQQDPVFSGPQPGEAITPFPVKLAYEDKTVDPVTAASGKPIMLIFVHQLTRPSVATVRALGKFIELRKSDLEGAVVFLSDDQTAIQQVLNRARRALPAHPPVGISPDGAEGPGAYGLNRNVTLTVIVAKDNKVQANFALKDTSVAVDVPKILEATCKVIGGTPPKLTELVPQMAMRMARPDQRLPELLRPVIRKDASKDDVDAAAKRVEQFVSRNRAAARQLGEILDRIVNAGKLDQYGTEHARTYLKKWHERYSGGKRNSEGQKDRGGN